MSLTADKGNPEEYELADKLRAKFDGWKLSEIMQQAREDGVSDAQLAKADDATPDGTPDAIKSAIISLMATCLMQKELELNEAEAAAADAAADLSELGTALN